MASRRRRFERPIGERRYKRLFVIAAEGDKTEPQYFGAFNGDGSVIHVKCLKSKHRSSPPQVLKRMEERLREESLNESDEAWLVVDKDQWSDEQLDQLYAWSRKKVNYGFALSNPKFEYWLLLHFEDGRGVASSQDCSKRLRGFLPDYDKGVDARKITRESIDAAVRRARARDNPRCEDWPRAMGSTTVYRLVENILKE